MISACVVEMLEREEAAAVPLNAQIAQALGWNVWEHNGKWLMEAPSATPGKIDVAFVPDYLSILRDIVKMRTP